MKSRMTGAVASTGPGAATVTLSAADRGVFCACECLEVTADAPFHSDFYMCCFFREHTSLFVLLVALLSFMP